MSRDRSLPGSPAGSSVTGARAAHRATSPEEAVHSVGDLSAPALNEVPVRVGRQRDGRMSEDALDVVERGALTQHHRGRSVPEVVKPHVREPNPLAVTRERPRHVAGIERGSTRGREYEPEEVPREGRLPVALSVKGDRPGRRELVAAEPTDPGRPLHFLCALRAHLGPRLEPGLTRQHRSACRRSGCRGRGVDGHCRRSAGACRGRRHLVPG